MNPLLLTLALAAPAGGDLLDAVPVEAPVVARCQDVARFRERVEGNAWTAFLASEAGSPWRSMGREIVRDELRGHGHRRLEVDALWNVATSLPGEAVFFVEPPFLVGVLVETRGHTDELREALQPLFEGMGDEFSVQTRTVGSATLELYGHKGAKWDPQTAPEPTAGGRVPLGGDEEAGTDEAEGAMVLLVSPTHMGVFAGAVPMATLAEATRSLRVLEGQEAGSGSARFLSARRSAGVPVGGLELFVDFSALADLAREELASATNELDVDPITALGIDEGAWLFAGLDVQPGQRIDSGLRLELPAGGFASQMVGTLKPLPSDLLTRVTAGAWNVSAFHWDLPEFLKLVREKVIEVQGEDAQDWIGDGLSAGSGFTGADIENDLIGQLTGLFLTYNGLPEGGLSDDFEDNFATSVWTLGVRDMARFQSALEKVLGSVGALEEMDLVEVDGSDAYVVEVDEDISPGLAFTPKGLVFALRRDWLEAAVRTISGTPGAGDLLDDPRFQAAFDENLGAVAFGATDLTPLSVMSESLREFVESRSATTAGDDVPAALNPFDSVLVWSMHRTGSGLTLRAYTR